MKYNATIKWTDDPDTLIDVVVATGDVDENEDDDIFFYFRSENEMDSFKTEGVNDFILVDYTPIQF